VTPEEAVDAVLARLAERPLPASTYRLQLRPEFDFRAAAELCPYLAELGITHVYLSPIFTAAPGSPHGYDVVDHNSLRAELGGPDGFTELCAACRAYGLEILLDYVPNHMGIGAHNAWWQDVLENGPSSVYAPTFDIDWHPLKSELSNKVLVPILGDQFGEVLERGELRLERDGGAFRVRYYDHLFPVAPRAVPRILGHRLPELLDRLGEDDPDAAELLSIITALEKMPPRHQVAPGTVAERAREKEVAKRRLAALFAARPDIRDFVDESVRLLNGDPADPRSFDALEEVLANQAYRLAHWRVAGEEINYRRFFDINSLAAIRMEDEAVFARTHRLLLDLLADGRVQGVRIDHPDGLYAPTAYFRELQVAYLRRCAEAAAPGADRDAIAAAARARVEAGAGPLPLVVEKILGPDERMPVSWRVGGTTGYEFLSVASGLFAARENERAMTAIHFRFTGDRAEYRELVYECKRLIMASSMSSEINMLAHRLNRLSEMSRRTRDFTLNALTEALTEVIACLPIYRTYIDVTLDREVDARDRRYVESTIATAKRRNPSLNASIFDFVRDLMLLRHPETRSDGQRAEAVELVRKLQQVTGPVTAKAVEDTAFYRYARLISLCEVGGDPDIFGATPEAFHRLSLERLERWPLSLNATSTHDTKRSEDVRLRISALSEVPDEWMALLRRLTRINRRHRIEVDGVLCPDRSEELFFYQTVVGALPDDVEPGAAGWDELVARLQQYMEKAAREAKVHTTWTNPNPAYDEALQGFVDAVLRSDAFLAEVRPFQRRVARAGRIAALSLAALKLAAPGVADVYQGCELTELSLVDPDNRRPVDYAARRRLLAEIARRVDRPEDRLELARELVARDDGSAKLLLLREGLRFRREARELLVRGSYLPLHVDGPHARHTVAFARRHGARMLVCVAPRFLLSKPGDVWEGAVRLGDADPGQPLRCVVSGASVTARDGWLQLGDCYRGFPVALLAT
jgi:(1->4)-alpha-D-glucan 1-alpha-D-glucosylmutase